MPAGELQRPTQVRFQAPTLLWYCQAIELLEDLGYREYRKCGFTRLRPRTFSRNDRLLQILWVEPGERRLSQYERVRAILADRL